MQDVIVRWIDNTLRTVQIEDVLEPIAWTGYEPKSDRFVTIYADGTVTGDGSADERLGNISDWNGLNVSS